MVAATTTDYALIERRLVQVYKPKGISNPARRRFLRRSAAIGVVLAHSMPAYAASIEYMAGEVRLNGKRVGRKAKIRPGDKIQTGPNSRLTFALGQDAYMLRPLTLITLETKEDPAIVTGLRIVSGALLAVFGGGIKTIRTGLATAGIRGTGVYVETNPEMTYFCTCYGDVDLTCVSDNSTRTVATRNHVAHYVYAQPKCDGGIEKAPLMNHTNAELAILERLVGRRPVLPEK